MRMVTVGQKYRHYKGNDYEVLAVGRDSETTEQVVVYKALYESPDYGVGAVWVRPYQMFTEDVEVGGEVVPRFKAVEQ